MIEFFTERKCPICGKRKGKHFDHSKCEPAMIELRKKRYGKEQGVLDPVTRLVKNSG